MTNTTTTTNATERANRIAISTNQDGTHRAVFYRTHKEIAVIENSATTGWQAPQGTKTTTASREAYRVWLQEHAGEFGVDWKPELQEQAWNRRYWKYETDEQVEEDAIELMRWTIEATCKKAKRAVDIKSITLDSLVAKEAINSKTGEPIGYIVDGKYEKNGNWASADVNLEVVMEIEGVEVEIIWTISMVSGQLKKVKMAVSEINQMMQDGMKKIG